MSKYIAYVCVLCIYIYFALCSAMTFGIRQNWLPPANKAVRIDLSKLNCHEQTRIVYKFAAFAQHLLC